MGNKVSRPKDLAGILEDEKLLMNSARLRQWREDIKEVLKLGDKGNIYKDIDKEKIKKEYEMEHITINKEELLLRLEILDEVLEFIKR